MTNRIITGVKALTKIKGQTYEEYVEVVLENIDACHVKLCDLRHNLDARRLKGVEGKDIKRIDRYVKLYKRIETRLREEGRLI